MKTRVVTCLALLCLLVPAMMGGCNGGSIKLFVDSPSNGSFETGSSIFVEGRITKLAPAQALLTVNGVVVPVLPDRTWSTTVDLSLIPDIVKPIIVDLERVSDGLLLRRERVTVIQGESIVDGELSPEAVALRLNDSGLNQVEPVVEGLVDLDLAALLPPGTLVIDNFCYVDTFLGCGGRVDAVVSGSPPPSAGAFTIDIDSQTNSVDADVVLNDLFIKANVFTVSGVLSFSCDVTITAATTDIDGNYLLDPDTVDPSSIDVTQSGNASLTFGSFNDSTSCGGFLGGIVEFFIDLLIGDIQDLIQPQIAAFLNTVDVDGNTPIAGAVEMALADVEISGPIGQAIGVNLETPLFEVVEDVNGITLGNDARITAALPDPAAADLLASYHVPEAFPSFGPTTFVDGVGQVPYDMALCISSSGFNQLLKAEVESGLLLATVTEADLGFGGGLEPLTAGSLAFLPGFNLLPPTLLLRIDLLPTVGPMLTGAAGPGQELAELKVPHLLASLVTNDGSEEVLLSFAVDLNLGLDLDFVGGALSFELGSLTAANIDITLLDNFFLLPEASLTQLLEYVLPSLLPSLTTSLGTFPLPDFLGLQLSLVDVSKNGAFLSLFVNLTPAP